MLPESLLPLKVESGSAGPRGRPPPSPPTGMLNLLLQGPGSREFIKPWFDTMHRVNKMIHELSMPKGTELVYRVARGASPPQCEFCPIKCGYVQTQISVCMTSL
jgi:hypothetical protein